MQAVAASARAGRRCGRGRGGRRLLELLLVDFALLGPAVLEPDFHLETKRDFFNSVFRRAEIARYHQISCHVTVRVSLLTCSGFVSMSTVVTTINQSCDQSN